VSVELIVLVALAGIVAGVVLAVGAVARLTRLAGRPELARVPIAERSAVELPKPGRAELAIEGPLFTARFRGLDFALVDAAGADVPLRRLWVRSSNGGFSRTRLSLYGCDVPRAGTYELRVTGIDPAADYSGCAALFVEPSASELALTIVGLLAAVGLAAGSFATAGALLFRTPAPDEPATAAAPVAAVPIGRAPLVESRGGRMLRSEPARLAGGQDVEWPALRIRVRVPEDWVVQKVTTWDLDVRSPWTPSTFVVAHATPMPVGPATDDYLAAEIEHARTALAEERIEGYAARRIAGVAGVATIERRDDGKAWMITWTGFQAAEPGSVSVTLAAGASAPDFAKDETLLLAIVDSVRFD